MRRARPGERLRTLDGVERELTTADLMIADAERSVALAGIMGGEETEIGEQTTTVLLEAANFEPHGLFSTSERLRLRTEGSNRWEKGVDPYLAEPAANLATRLLLELTGATLTAHSDVHGELPARPVIRYRPERADAVIGLATPADDQLRPARAARLRPRGRDRRGPDVAFTRCDARDRRRRGGGALPARGRAVHAPAAPRDVRDADAQPAAPSPASRTRWSGWASPRSTRRRLRPDGDTSWRLPEPISVDFTVLRTRLLPSLVDAAARNLDAGASEIALFEIARVFLEGGELPDEHVRVAGIAAGGFFHGKGVVEALYAALKAEPAFERTEDPLLHPGKAARTAAGVVGELHPSLLDGTWCGFELDLEALFAESREPVSYHDVITYPAVRQDLAVVVGEDVEAGAIVEAAREAAGAELREIRVFDVYRGEPIPAGKKSIAFSVSFQSPERTLDDEDARRLRGSIVARLGELFGAELRE